MKISKDSTFGKFSLLQKEQKDMFVLFIFHEWLHL